MAARTTKKTPAERTERKAESDRLNLAKAQIKTVILYEGARIQPQTIEAIMKAPNGGLIPVDRSELDCFTVLTIFLPDLDRIAREGGMPTRKDLRAQQREAAAAAASEGDDPETAIL